MKKILLLFLLLPILGYSQQKQFNIDWDGTKILSTSSFSIEVPYFNKANFNYNFDSGLKFVSQWESSQFVNEKSISVTNISYSSISLSDLKDVDLKTIPSKPNYRIANSTARSKNYVYFEISPIVKDGDSFKKIRSFTINYDFASNAGLRNANSPNEITNSVLSSGNWYKFYVDRTGVFKLSKSFLSSLGASLDDVDPRNIKIYGNGGAMLPFSNSEFYPFDLQENAIKFIGEDDGVFNNEDYILFYAEGPKGNININDTQINTNINPYTDKSYYFLNISSGSGKRIQPFSQPIGTPDMTIDTFHDYKFHEVDEFNLVKLGRRWFGDKFDVENSKSFEFDFPNLVTTEPVKLKVYAATVAESTTSMEINVNGSVIENLVFSITSYNLAQQDWFDNEINVSSSPINVSLEYDNNGNPSAQAYIDYISIEAVRDLAYVDGQFIFKNNNVAQLSGIGQYNIGNAANIVEIWNITDKYNVTNYANTDSANTLSFKSVLGDLKTFVAIDSSNYFEPLIDNSYVVNQNIKGTIFQNNQGQFQDVDYIIVAPQIFLSQAQRLAEINKNQYNLNVKVVQLDKIYNEFSSGNQDVSAIKNLVRYVYDNASAPENRLKYLCLFGDASFDYKDRIPGNTNFVPSWNSYNSFSVTFSFVSDDFFGLMDENEGTNVTDSDKLDIAVGRILADSPQRATQLVDKIESYYKSQSYGSWRNTFVAVSDDVDVIGEASLQQTTNDIADEVSEEKPFMNVVKIHSDAYQQESSAGGDRYPEVTKAMSNAMEVGALVINYFGHGGEDGLAHERIFEKPNIDNLRNVCKLNCFVTVTCEFTKFDNPLRQTAGEFIYWNKDGGSIGLITTTRQVFQHTGEIFNEALGQYLFSFGSDNYTSIAEALRLTKVDPSISSNSQRRLVFFIGDPAMKLAFPKPNVKLTQINDVPVTQATDTLKALSKVKLSGEVTDGTGAIIANYNGTLSATIYDKEIDRQTLGNDLGSAVILDFKTLGEIIFRGQATITNGLFDFEFIVPRDISIPVGNGKVSFYSKTENPLQDNSGANFDIQIGGLNENAPEDNIGPTIKLYMNDESFVSGGVTNEQPSLLALLEDENGINTASGIGHDIVAIIDNDEASPYVLNSYYETDVDVYQTGKVNYPFRDLEPGLHTLTLKAWDVYNNSSTAEIQFLVFDKDQDLIINNVLNYPNPFVNYTEFWFNHNSLEPLDVSVQIFTVSGKLVRTLNGNTDNTDCCNQGTSSLSRSIVWDGRDDFGDKIGKGVYVYKLTVKSNTLNKKVEKFEKLVIL